MLALMQRLIDIGLDTVDAMHWAFECRNRARRTTLAGNMIIRLSDGKLHVQFADEPPDEPPPPNPDLTLCIHIDNIVVKVLSRLHTDEAIRKSDPK